MLDKSRASLAHYSLTTNRVNFDFGAIAILFRNILIIRFPVIVGRKDFQRLKLVLVAISATHIPSCKLSTPSSARNQCFEEVLSGDCTSILESVFDHGEARCIVHALPGQGRLPYAGGH